MVIAFILLICCITLIDFHILNHLYISGINPTWSCHIILFIRCWIQFAGILLKLLCLYSLCLYSGIWVVTFFFLFLILISGFSIKVVLTSWNELWKFSLVSHLKWKFYYVELVKSIYHTSEDQVHLSVFLPSTWLKIILWKRAAYLI